MAINDDEYDRCGDPKETLITPEPSEKLEDTAETPEPVEPAGKRVTRSTTGEGVVTPKCGPTKAAPPRTHKIPPETANKKKKLGVLRGKKVKRKGAKSHESVAASA